MDWRIILLIIIIFIPLLFSAWRAFKDHKRDNYLLFGFVFLIFVVIYCVCILKYQIISPNFSLKKDIEEIKQSRKEILQSKEEINKVATTLIRISNIMHDGSRRFGGMSEHHYNKIKALQNSIKDYVNIDIKYLMEKDIKEVQSEIEKSKK